MDDFSAGQFNKVFKMLGELMGEVKGINDRLDRINGSLQNHETRLSKLEAFRNRLRGEGSVISVIVASIVSIIIYVIKKFL